MQSGTAQQQQARIQDSEANRESNAARELSALDRQSDTEVENTDADSRVHADAGGQGGMGRGDEEPHAATDENPNQQDSDSTDGAAGLDITA